MRTKNISFMTILCLFVSGHILANGQMVGNEFIFENSKMRQVFSFKDDRVSILSIFDKENQKELIAENGLPYFEFQINGETVTSSMPIWIFVEYTERSMVNQGVEYVFHFEGKGSYKGLKLELYRQYFPNSTLTREKLQITSQQGYNFQLAIYESFFKYLDEGLKEGTIDCIITDHAPHAESEKNVELSKAPNGIIGFETALPAEIMNLVDPGHIDYLNLVRLTSYTPSKLLHIDNGCL